MKNHDTLNLDIKELINGKKYLLGFSGGTDSSALFHYLSQNNVSFDIAIVDYNLRNESKKEVEQAFTLSSTIGIKCHTLSVELDRTGSLEANARTARHDFFNLLVLENSYEGLILGHNLNDKLEWFLMQLTKGAGVSELLGMSHKDLKSKENYFIFRPLINTSKDEIMSYLYQNNILFSLDISNEDASFSPSLNSGIKRNYFRHNFTNTLCKEFATGIKKSFEILHSEKKELSEYKIESPHPQVFLISTPNSNTILEPAKILRGCDYVLKHHFNTVLTRGIRREILKNAGNGVCISDAITIGTFGDSILITPKIDFQLTKHQKENFRIHKIPKLSRPYLAKNNFSIIPL